MTQRHGAGTAAPVSTAHPEDSTRLRTVAVVGPPNTGKSTLFNRLTGLRQRVANYPGVTVEKRIGRARLPGKIDVHLIDLPGIYSLEPRSEDERVARDVLTGRMPGVSGPDAVILILDSTNLGRHLGFAAPILSLGIPTLVVLNMADSLRSGGGSLDLDAVAQQIGAPVVLVTARTGEGTEAIREFLAGALAVPAPLELPVIQDVRRCREWSAQIGEAADYRPPAAPRRPPPRWSPPLAQPPG